MTPHALMFWTASTKSEGDQHEDSDIGKVTYKLYSMEPGPVDITRKLVLCRAVRLGKSTYHETHICTDVEKTTTTIFKRTAHDVNRRFESAAFLSLTWAFWVALNWILS